MWCKLVETVQAEEGEVEARGRARTPSPLQHVLRTVLIGIAQLLVELYMNAVLRVLP